MGSFAGGEQSAMQPPSTLQLAKSPPPPSGFGTDPSAPPSCGPPEDEPDEEPDPDVEPEVELEVDPELDADVDPEVDPELELEADPELEPDALVSPDGVLPESVHAPSATSRRATGDEPKVHRTMTEASSVRNVTNGERVELYLRADGTAAATGSPAASDEW
jgi:hypothetical protein